MNPGKVVTALACLMALASGQKLNVNKHWAGVSPAFAARLSGGRGAVMPAFAQTPVVPASREGKNLRNTFPFNAAGRQESHHDHSHDHAHHEHHDESGLAPPPPARRPQPTLVDNRLARQGSSDDISLDIGSIAAAGEKCIDKVVMVEETEYDDVITCQHSYSQKCHTTYATDFEPQQEEECNENFKKRCFIEYKKRALEEKVEFCYTPLVRNCDIPGPTECTTEYQSQCTTRYHEHDVEDDVAECEETYEEKCEDVTQGYTTEQKCSKWPVNKCSLARKNVKKYSPETECKKVPYEVCGPSACPVEPGAEQCQERKETIVQDVPEETCSLEPQRECKQVTKLVPLLKPRENCLDIPKEVCGRSRTNPRKVNKPVIKKWCYTSLGGPTCSSQCRTDNQRGRCRPECNIPECPRCIPTPDVPPIDNNSGDCRSNPNSPSCRPVRPPTPDVSCSSFCIDALRRGECLPECTSVPQCPRCQCSRQCERDNRNGICRPECNQYPGVCPPCTERPPPAPTCSRQCERDNRNGICNPECNIPGVCPPCVPTCPSSCQRYLRNNDGCRSYNSRPECQVPECPVCDAPPPPTCSRRCEQFIRNGECRPECNVPECPPCQPRTTPRPTPTCPRQCQQAILRGQCPPECKSNPRCDCPGPTEKPPKGYLPPEKEHHY